MPVMSDHRRSRHATVSSLKTESPEALPLMDSPLLQYGQETARNAKVLQLAGTPFKPRPVSSPGLLQRSSVLEIVEGDLSSHIFRPTSEPATELGSLAPRKARHEESEDAALQSILGIAKSVVSTPPADSPLAEPSPSDRGLDHNSTSGSPKDLVGGALASAREFLSTPTETRDQIGKASLPTSMVIVRRAHQDVEKSTAFSRAIEVPTLVPTLGEVFHAVSPAKSMSSPSPHLGAYPLSSPTVQEHTQDGAIPTLLPRGSVRSTGKPILTLPSLSTALVDTVQSALTGIDTGLPILGRAATPTPSPSPTTEVLDAIKSIPSVLADLSDGAEGTTPTPSLWARSASSTPDVINHIVDGYFDQSVTSESPRSELPLPTLATSLPITLMPTGLKLLKVIKEDRKAEPNSSVAFPLLGDSPRDKLRNDRRATTTSISPKQPPYAITENMGDIMDDAMGRVSSVLTQSNLPTHGLVLPTSVHSAERPSGSEHPSKELGERQLDHFTPTDTLAPSSAVNKGVAEPLADAVDSVQVSPVPTPLAPQRNAASVSRSTSTTRLPLTGPIPSNPLSLVPRKHVDMTKDGILSSGTEEGPLPSSMSVPSDTAELAKTISAAQLDADALDHLEESPASQNEIDELYEHHLKKNGKAGRVKRKGPRLNVASNRVGGNRGGRRRKRIAKIKRGEGFPTGQALSQAEEIVDSTSSPFRKPRLAHGPVRLPAFLIKARSRELMGVAEQIESDAMHASRSPTETIPVSQLANAATAALEGTSSHPSSVPLPTAMIIRRRDLDPQTVPLGTEGNSSWGAIGLGIKSDSKSMLHTNMVDEQAIPMVTGLPPIMERAEGDAMDEDEWDDGLAELAKLVDSDEGPESADDGEGEDEDEQYEDEDELASHHRRFARSTETGPSDPLDSPIFRLANAFQGDDASAPPINGMTGSTHGAQTVLATRSTSPTSFSELLGRGLPTSALPSPISTMLSFQAPVSHSPVMDTPITPSSPLLGADTVPNTPVFDTGDTATFTGNADADYPSYAAGQNATNAALFDAVIASSVIGAVVCLGAVGWLALLLLRRRGHSSTTTSNRRMSIGSEIGPEDGMSEAKSGRSMMHFGPSTWIPNRAGTNYPTGNASIVTFNSQTASLDGATEKQRTWLEYSDEYGHLRAAGVNAGLWTSHGPWELPSDFRGSEASPPLPSVRTEFAVPDRTQSRHALTDSTSSSSSGSSNESRPSAQSSETSHFSQPNSPKVKWGVQYSSDPDLIFSTPPETPVKKPWSAPHRSDSPLASFKVQAQSSAIEEKSSNVAQPRSRSRSSSKSSSKSSKSLVMSLWQGKKAGPSPLSNSSDPAKDLQEITIRALPVDLPPPPPTPSPSVAEQPDVVQEHQSSKEDVFGPPAKPPKSAARRPFSQNAALISTSDSPSLSSDSKKARPMTMPHPLPAIFITDHPQALIPPEPPVPARSASQPGISSKRGTAFSSSSSTPAFSVRDPSFADLLPQAELPSSTSVSSAMTTRDDSSIIDPDMRFETIPDPTGDGSDLGSVQLFIEDDVVFDSLGDDELDELARLHDLNRQSYGFHSRSSMAHDTKKADSARRNSMIASFPAPPQSPPSLPTASAPPLSRQTPSPSISRRGQFAGTPSQQTEGAKPLLDPSLTRFSKTALDFDFARFDLGSSESLRAAARERLAQAAQTNIKKLANDGLNKHTANKHKSEFIDRDDTITDLRSAAQTFTNGRSRSHTVGGKTHVSRIPVSVRSHRTSLAEPAVLLQGGADDLSPSTSMASVSLSGRASMASISAASSTSAGSYDDVARVQLAEFVKRRSSATTTTIQQLIGRSPSGVPLPNPPLRYAGVIGRTLPKDSSESDLSVYSRESAYE